MRALKAKAVAALVATAVMAVPGVALANGSDFHFGASSTGIPVVVVFGFAGFVGVIVLFFLANWARYRRSQGRGAPSSESRRSQARDEEEGNGAAGKRE